MLPYISEIRSFAFSRVPMDWEPCDGRLLQVNDYTMHLFLLIGTTFGGDENHFRLPDLRNRTIIGSGPEYRAFTQGGEQMHQLIYHEMPRHHHTAIASVNGSDSVTPKDNFWPSDAGYATHNDNTMSDQATGKVGGDVPHNNMSPYLAINYAICVKGFPPPPDFKIVYDFAGTIRAFPKILYKGWWLPCDGTVLPIEHYKTLFSVIGWTYGGNKSTTFALPDLRGRATVNWGKPEGLSPYRLGEKGGETMVKLTTDHMPRHNHAALASTRGNTTQPGGHVWANEDRRPPVDGFASQKGEGAVMNPAALGEAGGDQPHNNMMPYLTLEYMIAAGGDMPLKG